MEMVEQFDFYWTDLNPTIGAEMQKVRPCVVVSPKELNQYLATVIIIPITSSIHGYPYRVACHIDGRSGEIVTDQIRTVDKRRLKKKIATLSTDERIKLQDVLRQMFSE
jgi:mRNA interferase MazF